MNRDILILAVETSYDETSVSAIKNGNTILSNIVFSQVESCKRFGGVVPEVASRHHVGRITTTIDEALSPANIITEDIDAIAVTQGPGLIGVLLIGINAAKALAFAYNKPIIPVHHIAGHIYASHLEEPLVFSLIALVVSGGHTELVYTKSHLNFEVIGETRDDIVGEAYDKVARTIGLSYPGGPAIDALALEGKDTYHFPRVWLEKDSYDFSFSGLKSAMINKSHNQRQKNKYIRKKDVATSFQNSVIDVLNTRAINTCKAHHVEHLIVAGGVAGNEGLRERLNHLCKENNIKLSIPNSKLCTGNAAMINAAGYYYYKAGVTLSLDLNGKNNIDIEDVTVE